MALSKEQLNSIEEVLKASLRNKFQNYEPEPASMPFHTRLLGKDRLVLYSFIHSLNTNFGTSIFEPVGLALAQKEFKRTLLEWVAVVLANKPDANINTFIAIPYNPYEPEPYNRWTMRGMLDLERELKVADEFWDFLGGKNTYKDLLDCFERVGIELRDEIDAYFKRFQK